MFPFGTKPVFTKDGYEICNAFPGRVISDAKRYINPKMENELKIFKKKIAARYANREIINWAFPFTADRDKNNSVESSARVGGRNKGGG